MRKGFISVSLCSPIVTVGNPSANLKEILNILKDIDTDIALFPELAITSYSCEDLFLNGELQKENDEAIKTLIKENPFDGLLIIGGTALNKGLLFNAAYVIKEHKLLGVVPKTYLPNYNEFSESRWFAPYLGNEAIKTIKFDGCEYPFGYIKFVCDNSCLPLEIGCEICEDLWSPISPSNLMSLNGCNVFMNLSASNDYLSKDVKRLQMVSEASRKVRGAYLYSSANSTESSSGLVFSSAHIFSLYGENILNSRELSNTNKISRVSIDLSAIDHARKVDSPFRESLSRFITDYCEVHFTLCEKENEKIEVNAHPFYFKDESDNLDRLFELSSYGIEKRIVHVGAKKLVLGLSGGLDSTMALLSLVETCKRFNHPLDMIYPVALPSSNSTSRTKNNASKLCEALGLKLNVISIEEELNTLLSSINHKEKDVTYENAQVRIRTNILMELSNKFSGIMIGTSDLSEIALGYSTFNGDHMSMYSINTSIPKTMMQGIIRAYASRQTNDTLKQVLNDIVDTPISAELNTNQLTEAEVGKYEYIDFILFRYLKRNDSKEIIKMLLSETFGLSSENASVIVDSFFKRFFASQYKRNAAPDGLKITPHSLDSHLDYRLPSDIRR